VLNLQNHFTGAVVKDKVGGKEEIELFSAVIPMFVESMLSSRCRAIPCNSSNDLVK
jgi:hypothetical protein